MKLHLRTVLLGTMSITLASCFNGKSLRKVVNTPPSTGLAFTHSITAATTGVTAASVEVMNLQFAQIGGSGNVSNFCTPATNCTCSYNWTYSGVARSDVVAFQSSGPDSAVCGLPLAWAEISEGTTLSVSAASANNTMRTTVVPFTKGGVGSGTNSEFVDASGRPYNNISRAVVYEDQRIFKTILNKVVTQDGPSSISNPPPRLRVVSAVKFCAGGISGDNDCNHQTESSATSSNLAIPYNIYFRSLTPTPVSNSRYKVVAVNNAGSYPNDSSFALSPSQFENSVPIEANSRPSNAANAETAPNSCLNGTPGGTLTNDRLSSQCLGFAYRPNPNGSCPVVQFSSGPVQTTRLRKFSVIYPLTIEVRGTNTGRVRSQSQAIDTVYVADRVLEGLNTGSGLWEPRGTYRGPLPCPFSIYDSQGVTGDLFHFNSSYNPQPYDTRHGGIPKYVASNDPAWNDGATFDGTSYPAVDSFDPAQAKQYGSCSAALPWFPKGTNGAHGTMYIRTAGIPAHLRNVAANGGGSCSPGNAINWRNGGASGFPGFSMGGIGNFKTLGTAFEGTGGAVLPEWQEVKSFQACVVPRMVTDPVTGILGPKIKDPPIHVQKTMVWRPDVPLTDTSNVALPNQIEVASWCAETLPTQILKLNKIDSPNPANPVTPGFVKNYTSHHRKNQINPSAPCTARIPASLPAFPGYNNSGMNQPFLLPACLSVSLPSGWTRNSMVPVGWARHQQITLATPAPGYATTYNNHETCDKDVNDTFDLDFPPLLQEEADVERSLDQRPNIWGCFITSGTAKYNYEDQNMRTPPHCCSPTVMNTSASTGHFEMEDSVPNCGNARE